MHMEYARDWAIAYLCHWLDNPAVELTVFERFPRGTSRDTWFVSYRDRPGAALEHHLVFRMDGPTGSLEPSQLWHEYFIYERLGRTNVPVAKELHWEADPDWIGAAGPFYIRIRVEGDWQVPGFLDPDPAYDELRIAVSRNHLEKLALVHAVDWRALGLDEILPPPPSCDQAADHFIDEVLRRVEKVQQRGVREGMPVVLEAVEALRRDAPAAPRLCLCKGTNGLGEEVLRGREVVALSDWEEAHLGNPAADFAFMQNFVPEIDRDGRNLWGLEKAVAYYREVSAIPITVEMVQYYFKLRMLKGLTYTVNAAVNAELTPSSTIRTPWTGLEPANLTKRLLAAAAGLMAPVTADHFQEFMVTL
jgi:aminoglycoside phosphotransferase (APT) family kinase protein